MIERAQFATVLGFLAALFPRFELKGSTVDAYYSVLGDLDLELLKAAALALGSEESPWFPSAGQIRQRAFDLLEREAGIPTAGEAWAEALKRVDLYRPPGRSDFSHPLVYEALEAIGGNRALGMTMESERAAPRARFIQAYEALLKRERAQVRALPQVRETAARLAAGERRLVKGER